MEKSSIIALEMLYLYQDSTQDPYHLIDIRPFQQCSSNTIWETSWFGLTYNDLIKLYEDDIYGTNVSNSST